MSDAAKILIDQALELPSSERAIVAEQILLSLDRPDKEIDAAWAAEAENRIDAYEKGEIQAASIGEVLGKYDQE
jgi:putative addiction module component (TIGR02574 family)